jgi:hemerythrin-like domain-containing protein
VSISPFLPCDKVCTVPFAYLLPNVTNQAKGKRFMDPINVLMNEHRVIEQVLDAFETTIRNFAETGELDRAKLAQYVRFIREFADAMHHGKEEDHLFEKMVEHGFPRDQGPVAAMFSDHDLGRQYAKVLSDASRNGRDGWTEDEANEIGRASVQYIELLRGHIHKEDNILYVMARRQIPADEMYQMGKTFESIAAGHTATGASEELYKLAAELTGK